MSESEEKNRLRPENCRNAIWDRRRRRIFEIIEVGAEYDRISRAYDFFSVFIVVLNIAASTMVTFDYMEAHFSRWLYAIEGVTVALFCADFILRVWTAKFLFPECGELRAVFKYLFSFTGLIDLLSFLPYYLPVFFPSGAAVFRMFRIIRIFRLFRVNAYYDSLKVITEVITSKKQQLISSVFIILTLMLASSLCMYSLENEAQPEVFSNAFSGIWWAASTLLTVGYGDIYPITSAGKIFGIFITFLGVGMVAIPTGIISAGFVDQYSRIKRMSEYGNEEDIHFIRVHLQEQDPWVGQRISSINLPKRVIIAVVQRGRKIRIPRGDLVLQRNDVLVLGAESFQDKEELIRLKELVLKANHPWCGHRICELDLSRHSIIVLVKRKNTVMIPSGDLLLREGDTIVLYTQTYLSGAVDMDV